jgi:single-strand DNA-binding protein
MDRAQIAVRNMLSAIEAPLYDIGVLGERGMLPRLAGISAAEVLDRLPLIKYRNVRGCHIYIRPSSEHRFTVLDDLNEAVLALLSFSVPRHVQPRPSDARSPSRNPPKRLFEVWTPPPKQVWVPFHRFRPLASGEAWRRHTPRASMYRRQRTQPKETEPNTMFNKITLIGRPGQNPEAKTAQNNREYVVLNIATQESWKNDKGDYETRTEWHRVFAWRSLSKFAKTLQKGQLITLEGTLRYREVEDEVKGTTFKQPDCRGSSRQQHEAALQD